MTQSALIAKFDDLSQGFSVAERVSLNDLLALLRKVETTILEWAGADTSDPPIANLLPEDLPIGDQLGLDSLTYLPASDEAPRQLYFTISWQDARWEIFPGVFTIEGFDLAFTIIGRQVAVSITGFATLEGLSLTLSLDLPSYLVRGHLADPEASDNASPAPLLERFASFPGGQTDAPAGFLLQDLSLAANPVAQLFTMHLAYTGLPLGPVTMAGDLQLRYEAGAASGECWADFQFTANGQDYLIALHAAHPGPDAGWQLEGGLAIADGLQLTHLISYFGTQFGVSGADELGFDTDVGLKYIYLSVDTATHQYTFTVDLEMSDPFVAELKLTIDLTKQESGKYDKEFSGELTLGQEGNQRIFDLVFSDKAIGAAAAAGRKKQILALYRKPGGEEIPLKKLLAAVFDDTRDLPDFSFRILDAMVVLLKEPDGTKKYLFTSDMDFGLDLSGLRSLPLIGTALPKDLALKLNFQPIFTSREATKRFSKTDLEDITAIIPADGPQLPAELTDWKALITTIQIGDLKKTLELGIGADQVDDELGTTAPPAAAPAPAGGGGGAAAPAPASAGDDQLKWIELGKKFGPLQLGRVGLGFAGGAIDIRLDAGLALGPVQFALQGLGAHYVLATKELTFSLDGLGLEIKNGPLEIAGAFLRLDDQFVGKVTVKAEGFGFVALGAYGEFEGHPSLFLYAFVQIPPAGPIFFQVEGIAFGFGINRRLVVPPIGEMYKFPLVSEAAGTSRPAPGLAGSQGDFASALRAEFTMLAKYIPPQVGQYFLAVGLKFSSFQTLESFALLVVNFGRRFDLAILGITKLSVPKVDDENAPRIAEVEMAFSVVFIPDEGFLAVEARLTPNSYIFSSLCKLQGGFAFYSWFKGEHEGDFVVTLGGYHYKYHPAKHYPQPADVPRLGFNWRLSDHLYLKGEAYYALTPKAMMMGGRLEGHLDVEASQFTAEAWFIAKADFLMFWQPFHYEASISVEIGVKYAIHFLGTHRGSLSAGADLEIWGPEFAGHANVHAKVWGIKVSFSVDINGGTRPARPRRIQWGTFKSSFLPADAARKALSFQAQGGVVRSLEDPATQTERWVLNPQELVIGLNSIIPQTRRVAAYAGDQPLDQDWPAAEVTAIPGLSAPAALGVEPVGIAPSQFDSQLILRLKRDGVAIDLTSEFHLLPIDKQFPKALWTDSLSTGSRPAVNGKQMVSGRAGYRLVPAQPGQPDETRAFPVEHLQFDQHGRTMPTDRAIRAEYAVAAGLQPPGQQGDARRAILRQLGFDPGADDQRSPNLHEAFIFEPLAVTVQ